MFWLCICNSKQHLTVEARLCRRKNGVAERGEAVVVTSVDGDVRGGGGAIRGVVEQDAHRERKAQPND